MQLLRLCFFLCMHVAGFLMWQWLICCKVYMKLECLEIEAEVIEARARYLVRQSARGS